MRTAGIFGGILLEDRGIVRLLDRVPDDLICRRRWRRLSSRDLLPQIIPALSRVRDVRARRIFTHELIEDRGIARSLDRGPDDVLGGWRWRSLRGGNLLFQLIPAPLGVRQMRACRKLAGEIIEDCRIRRAFDGIPDDLVGGRRRWNAGGSGGDLLLQLVGTRLRLGSMLAGGKLADEIIEDRGIVRILIAVQTISSAVGGGGMRAAAAACACLSSSRRDWAAFRCGVVGNFAMNSSNTAG